MKEHDEIESVVFQALSNPMRRRIIKILEDNNGVSYTELINQLGLSTGKMNYHLEQLEGLIEKNGDRHYVLTSLGKKAFRQIGRLELEVTEEDKKYATIAKHKQKTSLEPTVKAFIISGIVVSIAVTGALCSLLAMALIQGGVPAVMVWFLPFGLAIEIAVLATLIYSLRKAPAWLRRIESRFFQAT
jgi:predicted transcriptional regulator